MALIIENGYPVLLLDVGNGHEQVINDKFVADDKWYQFIIDRYFFTLCTENLLIILFVELDIMPN